MNRGARKRTEKVLKRRLASWVREKHTNAHGLRDMAPKVIDAIRAELSVRLH